MGIWDSSLRAMLQAAVFACAAGGGQALGGQGYSSSGAPVDLTGAIVVGSAPAPSGEHKAIAMLCEEVEKRTGIRWTTSHQAPPANTPVILVCSRPALPGWAAKAKLAQAPLQKAGTPAAESYVLTIDTKLRPAPTVLAVGNDARGTLFAVGRLLRNLRLAKGKVKLDSRLSVAEAPAYPIRGHQLGYRPKSNTYDAWDLARYEQYIRDLIVFGANSIELITPLAPDDTSEKSPLMPVDPWEMTRKLSELLDSYGLNVWLWLPVNDTDIGDPAVRKRNLEQRGKLFEMCKRLDAVSVPGGDPGSTAPEILMPYLRELASALHKSHPQAQVWVSNQGFSAEWLKTFYAYLRESQPDWLAGVVHGPWTRQTLAQVRASVPERYPVRDYPDICHTVRCQYPVPRWDKAFATALNREPANPRPTEYAHIHNLTAPHTVGSIAYSDGVNDDVNKIIWGALDWNPKANVRTILVEYGRYFIGQEFADAVVDGLLMLERNWTAPLATSDQVDPTLTHWQALERQAPPEALANWRFQQCLFRAYADAYIKQRLLQADRLQKEALAELGKAPEAGADAAMKAARAILARADSESPAPQLWQRCQELAGELFRSIGMQLSTKLYGASAPGRGAVLDTINLPLNDRKWLEARFDELEKAPSEEAKLAGIREIVDWDNPGPGGFYDDLGDPWREPHLVLEPGWEKDPSFLESAQNESGGPDTGKQSWINQGETLYGTPLRMRYEGLDPKASYALRATYTGRLNAVMRLVANGKYEIHGPIGPEDPPRPVEFPITRRATSGEKLELAWTAVSGRGPQVAEVWLIKR